MEQKERLELLKKILLTEEKEITDSLLTEVGRLARTLDEPEEFAAKVNPLVDEKINKLVSDMPKKLSPVITSALKYEIANSQDAVIEALFPIIGKLIKKYISHEINLLNEQINNKIKEAFSFKNFFRAKFGNKKLADEIIVTANAAQLLQVLVIEKESGILVANYNQNNAEAVDEDMVAGMLTAIKSFVEDAFKGGDQNLETISYELYTLHIQNLHNYYIVAVVSGSYTTIIKDKLENIILDFAQNGVSKQDINDNELFSNRLKTFFSDKII